MKPSALPGGPGGAHAGEGQPAAVIGDAIVAFEVEVEDAKRGGGSQGDAGGAIGRDGVIKRYFGQVFAPGVGHGRRAGDAAFMGTGIAEGQGERGIVFRAQHMDGRAGVGVARKMCLRCPESDLADGEGGWGVELVEAEGDAGQGKWQVIAVIDIVLVAPRAVVWAGRVEGIDDGLPAGYEFCGRGELQEFLVPVHNPERNVRDIGVFGEKDIKNELAAVGVSQAARGKGQRGAEAEFAEGADLCLAVALHGGSAVQIGHGKCRRAAWRADDGREFIASLEERLGTEDAAAEQGEGGEKTSRQELRVMGHGHAWCSRGGGVNRDEMDG